MMTVVERRESELLANAEAAVAFWRTIERREPMGVAQAIRDAIAHLIARRDPRVDGLRALLVLDRRAQMLVEEQLLAFSSSPLDSTTKAQHVRHTVFELARAFASGYLHFLEHVRGRHLRSAWVDGTSALLVRLMYHRQIELMLHLLRYEAWPHGRWRELHDAYRFAREYAAAAARRDEGHGESGITGENMYVRILLTQLLDTGQFLGHELVIARKWIVRWSNLVSLRPLAVAETAAHPNSGFVVDTVGGRGLQRRLSRHHGDCLWLDTTAIVAAIEDEVAGLRANASVSRLRRIALLARLKMVFAPVPVRVERRGERKPVALTSVQMTTGGLGSIFAMLRDEWKQRATTGSVPAPTGAEDISILITPSRSPGTALAGIAQEELSAFPPTLSFGVPQPAWHLCDRSVSGARMRGRVSNPERTLPGSLVAFRDDERAAWTLAVVRRLKRLPGNNVEVGVEHLGSNAQPIVLSALDRDPAMPAHVPALYLRESAMDVSPRMRTIVVPAAHFQCGRAFVMSSAKAEVSIRLKSALEYQPDFVWATFEALASVPDQAQQSQPR